ncbi:type IV pilus biogenesis/stability protein PilW [Rhodoferax antarcticus]|nr:type IV pilus biogenesis/stability protein PilW [Rhodoferax antarcticus]
MKNRATRRLDLFFAFFIFCSWITLSGCAGHAGSPGAVAMQGDIITESDETAERKRARIRVELALGYLEQGKSTIALDEIKQAILIDPTYSDAFSLRGLIYMRLSDYGIAEESFNKALSLKPRDSNVLHNMAWLKCQDGQYAQSMVYFNQALANPLYRERAKTHMAQGLCQIKAGQLPEAEASLLKSYEYDAGNPVTGYNLSNVLYQRKDFARAQFYIRRLNNTELANAETLWLGVKIERRMANLEAMNQLAVQLVKRFPQSAEASLYQRGAFDE